MASWCESLDRAMALEPDHLALYALSYEGGTALARRRELGQVRPCDEELEADMYRTALERVGGHGYEQYEISNFARPGCRCRHNLAYWDHQPYVGVGPSAVGYLDGVRYRNVPDIARYVELMDRQGDAVVERECIRGRGLAAEMAMLRLRLNEGIDVARFEGRTSLDPHVVFAGAIRRFERMGLIEATATRIALTDSGRLYADTIIADFMSELDLVPASNVAGTRCDTTP